MALIDDPAFIISHLRHAYLTSDDTGMSEMVIINEEVDGRRKDKVQDRGYSSEVNRAILDEYGYGEQDNFAESYEIESSFDVGIRRRSNTAVRLEKLKQQRKAQPKTKHVQWKERPVPFTDNDSGLFEKKELVKKTSNKSALTLLLEKFPHQANKLYNDYTKFDGRIHLNSTSINVKRINIYLTMLPPHERSFPMTVFVIPSAKVLDLIGLICWQYNNEGLQPVLEKDVDRYSLHIAEDDGEVDSDFPALDNREVISKFGFHTLAFVEAPTPPEPDKKAILVQIKYFFLRGNVPQSGFSLIEVDSLQTPMKDILHKTLKRRKGNVRVGGPDYILEKQSEPGVAVDLKSTLESQNTMEFCLVRENSLRGDLIANEEMEELELSGPSFLAGYQYRSYRVSMIHKFKSNIEVQLGISGDKVEIDPVSQPSSKIWRPQKAVSYEVDSIAACDLIDGKHAGKSVFRLTYVTGNDFKHHDFESDAATASEVATKISHILELRSSHVRQGYLFNRTRRGSRKM